MFFHALSGHGIKGPRSVGSICDCKDVLDIIIVSFVVILVLYFQAFCRAFCEVSAFAPIMRIWNSMPERSCESMWGPKARLDADLMCLRKAGGMLTGTNMDCGLPYAFDNFSWKLSKVTPPDSMIDVIGNALILSPYSCWNLTVG